MTENITCGIVPPEMEGRRLDQALESLLPGAGLRERKRAWETGEVLVDGRPRPKGYRVMAGQTIALRPGCAPSATGEVPEGVRVVAQNTGYMAALFKPGGVHSEAVAGRQGPSVDLCLQAFWPGRFARLVNRLDFLTSGLLAVALSEQAAGEYLALEDRAEVTKVYAALVQGRVVEPLLCSGAIDAARRRVVRVLDTEDASGLRRTEVEPVLYDEARDATVVRCVIHKGARHQIRAHLAAAGHPVVGDPLYGYGPAEHLYLHHLRLSLPAFEACAAPAWAEWSAWGLAVSRF